MIPFHCAVAMSLVLLQGASSRADTDELVPSEGLFAWQAPEPYDLAIREALVGEHDYRKCQMLAVPSFEPEWAVYLVRDEATSPQIVAKRLRQQLWSEMMDFLSASGTKDGYDIGPVAQAAALATLRADVDRATAAVSVDTADALEQVWHEMLGRVRYANERTCGRDGTTYHVSHWGQRCGVRSGTTWSPDEGSRPAALVGLAEAMRDLALGAAADRCAKDLALAADARALLAQLKQLEDPSRPR